MCVEEFINVFIEYNTNIKHIFNQEIKLLQQTIAQITNQEKININKEGREKV